jgi:hypothetical protein
MANVCQRPEFQRPRIRKMIEAAGNAVLAKGVAKRPADP